MLKQSPSHPSISPAKRGLFIAIAISLPLVLLAAAELTLRVFGWGGYPSWIREAGKLPSGDTLCIVEPAAAKPYFYANPASAGSADQSTFTMPKPKDTVRIFLIGESAAKGYPQPRNLAMSAFLRAMLSDAWPEKKVEVINLGTTAVASFPLVYQVRDALKFSPDLFIFYAGNNEFFGAYGTASINAAGSLPLWALRWMRAARGLALVQVLDDWLYQGADENRSLMEEMIGQTVIPADSPLRKAAADNLAANLGTMLDEVRGAGVPSIVCTTASNESGLAPLGEDDTTGLDEKQQRELKRLMGEAAEAADRDDFARAVNLLRQAVQLAPRHARARFLLGQVLARAKQPELAHVSFLEARDLDTLPWRPISLTEQAIRNTALVKGAVFCDVAEIFRKESPDGATGWELLDDHVHLSLSGQARAARSMVGAMVNLSGPLQLGPDELALVQEDQIYADGLGTNRYDDYAVNHTLRVLFGVPFMKKTNAQAFDVYSELCRTSEEEMSPVVLQAVSEWRNLPEGSRALRPITSLAARALLNEGKDDEALKLYEIAAGQVPDYTSWYLEYVYFALACRLKIEGQLGAEDLRVAAEAIAQGRFIVANRLAPGDAAENFYVGRLHQLRGEWAEAIPFFLAARSQMQGEDLVAADQALVFSCLKTERRKDALAILEEGIRKGGQFEGSYRAAREQLGE